MPKPCATPCTHYDYTVNESQAPSARRLGYVRVSDQEQTEALQHDALIQAGCHLIYRDHGISGTKTTRDGLDRLLQDLHPGDTLIVWKLDRLGRSTLHLLQLLAELQERSVDFIALTQGIDTTTAIGRMLYGQLAVFAEFEREQISDRTRAGMAAARARGVRIGRPRIISTRQARRYATQIANGDTTLSALAARIGVSPQTLARAIRV
ncbi:recombinase family protein [Rhodobacteraceae bacterium CCMM004]|nr:recombinase family protein [Rhodobacteraceae bacterium CCMM004]